MPCLGLSDPNLGGSSKPRGLFSSKIYILKLVKPKLTSLAQVLAKGSSFNVILHEKQVIKNMNFFLSAAILADLIQNCHLSYRAKNHVFILKPSKTRQ